MNRALLKTVTEAAVATAENAVKYVLTETEVVKYVTNGEVKCVPCHKKKQKK